VLERSFCLAEAELAPMGWPKELAPLRVLLITDIHGGIFLKPQTLWSIVRSLMQTKPDLVVICGDLVTGHVSEATPYLDALAGLTDAPLGAWFCFGNHDYFGGDPGELQDNLVALGIKTLKNDSVVLAHHGNSFVLGGIDDRVMGKPDWQRLISRHGPPHLLMAHNPDHFYDAEARGVPLTLSGHTHGGQIRFPNGPAIIRQSRYCLDEGVYAFRSSLLVVSRGLGSIVLPFRWGAEPEAVLLEITAPD
jgi:predicted MPP superfamily phosphohydrolase